MCDESEKRTSSRSISCAGASRAKTSLKPAAAPDSQAPAPGSGTSTSVSSTSSTPTSSWSRTCRRLLRAGWTRLSVDSSGSVTSSTVARSPRPTSERHTDAPGSSLWPTLVSTDATRRSATIAPRAPSDKRGRTLLEAMQAWPTPTATSYGTSNNGHPGDARERFETAGKTIARWEGGRINPDWVEALMGFPIGWTDGPLDPETLPLFGSHPEPHGSGRP